METTTVKDCVETVSETRVELEAHATSTPTTAEPPRGRKRFSQFILSTIVLAALAIVIGLMTTRRLSNPAPPQADQEIGSAPDPNSVTIDATQMQSIKVAAATSQGFRAEQVATGKIAFNEEFMTPVFSPYIGRVIRLLAKPGDVIKEGSPLFEIDTPDLVQAETDLITADISLAKSNAALELAHRTEDRQHRLYLDKAVALKDWEQAESDVKNAERDVRSAESAVTAARARLRVFGKSDEEIVRIENERQVDRITRVRSPIAGTITVRKVGPGQYVKPDSPDALFTVADLSTVWILADVYESDVPLLKVGQPVEVRIAAYPDDVFTARITYISPSVDPATHRVAVRGVIENRGQRLKPDMLASFRIVTNSEVHSLAVPLSAIIHEGSRASIWVAQTSNQFVKREVTIGLQQDGYAQIVSGLQPGEKVATAGSLFLANAASSQD